MSTPNRVFLIYPQGEYLLDHISVETATELPPILGWPQYWWECDGEIKLWPSPEGKGVGIRKE